MTPTTPPRAAAWLLMRLASGPQRTALAGDLHEQYQRRRSAMWYWRQALSAIAVGALHDAGDHLLLVARAIALWYVLFWAVASVTIALHQSLGLIVWNWTVNHGFDMLRLFWFGRPRLGNPLMLTVACVNSMWIGWVVIRLHLRHAAAVLLTAAAFILFYAVIVRYTWVASVWPRTFFVNAPFVAPMPYFVAAIGVPLCFLFGGLLGTAPEDDHPYDGQTVRVPSR